MRVRLRLLLRQPKPSPLLSYTSSKIEWTPAQFDWIAIQA